MSIHKPLCPGAMRGRYVSLDMSQRPGEKADKGGQHHSPGGEWCARREGVRPWEEAPELGSQRIPLYGHSFAPRPWGWGDSHGGAAGVEPWPWHQAH